MDLYRARWLLPIDREPIEKGALLVDDGRVVAVGPDLRANGATAHELGDCILLPGFINAHTHLELSCYKGQLPPGSLWDWLEELIALRRRSDASETEKHAVLDGVAESLAAGVTCIGDISRTGLNVEILRTSPIRKVCFLELFSGAKQPPNDTATLHQAFENASRFTEPDRLMIGLSPHAPYSVGWQDLVGAIDLAARNHLPLMMHLLETHDEQQWLENGNGPLAEFLSRYGLPNARTDEPRGLRDILVRSGLLDRAPLLAHANYIDDEQISLLAQSHATVVWCPRTHSFFSHRPHRWPDMIAAGINVCLGTDSLASAPSLSILDDLRHLRRQAPDASPTLLLDMATRRAATGLGVADCIGTLIPGKYADFIEISWDPAGPTDPIPNIIDGGGKVVATWIGGHRVFPASRNCER